MERIVKKSRKQLYNKLLLIYTAVIVCVVAALMIYFTTSMRRRYLENNLEFLQMAHGDAIGYVEDFSNMAFEVYPSLLRLVFVSYEKEI